MAHPDVAAAVPVEPEGVTTGAAVGEQQRSREEIGPVRDLTDPDTWRKILNDGFRVKRSLTQIWKDDLAPLIGVPCPFELKITKLGYLDAAVPRLRSLGVVLKQYTHSDRELNWIIDSLENCNRDIVVPLMVKIERFLKLRI